MALDTLAPVVASGGFMFFANVGENLPANWKTADLSATPSALTNWESVGYSSLEDLPEFGSDGGDTETLGAWEAKSLRQVLTEASTDYLTINLYQFDRNVLQMYWGVGTVTDGKFAVSSVGATAVEKAFLMVITDGSTRVAFHAHKASFRRDDSLSLATDNFAQWPIRVTFLNHTTNPLFSWNADTIDVPA